MRNLVRSILIAAFVMGNGWMLAVYSFPATAVGFYLSTALLLASRLLSPSRISRFRPGGDEVPQSVFPFVFSVFPAAGLAVFIFLKIHTAETYFFSKFLERWTVNEAFIVLILSALMVSTALTVATSAKYGRLPRGEALRNSLGARVLMAHRSELSRMFIYLYFTLFFWCVGLAALALFTQEHSLAELLVFCARTSICMVLVIIGVFFSLPFSIFLVVGLACYAAALHHALGAAQTALFMCAAIGSATALLGWAVVSLRGRETYFSVEVKT